jgi:hypothetical protein
MPEPSWDWLRGFPPDTWVLQDGKIRSTVGLCPVQHWVATRNPQLAEMRAPDALMFLFGRSLNGHEEMMVASIMEAADHPDSPDRARLETCLGIMNYGLSPDTGHDLDDGRESGTGSHPLG